MKSEVWFMVAVAAISFLSVVAALYRLGML